MGVVKTNALSVGNGSGSGGGNGADLPTHLSSISANGGNSFVTLTIDYTNTNYVSGVQVNYKTDSYPTSPSDGRSMSVSGAQTSIKVTGLTNKLTYYFRVFLFNEVDGVKYYQTDITNAMATCIPRSVEINGITPLVSAADHIVIVESGTGTISAPQGTKIIMGTNGVPYGMDVNSNGGIVGYTILTSDINDAPLAVTIAAKGGYRNATTVKIGNATYNHWNNGSKNNIIYSKWGPIGGVGGYGGSYDSEYSRYSDGGSGTGAGGGGGVNDPRYADAGFGGNSYGYGNKGGNGGSDYKDWTGSSGSSGAGGKGNSDGTGGGGGGYAAGGGNGGTGYDDYTDDGEDGESGTGIVVIEWNE